MPHLIRLNRLVLGSFVLICLGVGTSHAQMDLGYVEGEVIVRMKPGVSASSVKFQGKAGQRLKTKADYKNLKMRHMKGLDGQSTAQIINQLQNDPNVEYVEPNWIVSKTSGSNSVQAYTLTEVQSFASGFGLTSAPIKGVEGWDEIASTNDPVVAVIDTGVQLDHPTIADALWENMGEIPGNGIDDDGNGFVDDINGWNFVNNNNNPNDCDGHGTHVAGAIRGTTQYLFDDPVDTPVIQIMALKFLDCNGFGSTSDAIDAIYYAVKNGAKVLNNSWGGGQYSQALHEAIAYSYEKKTVFVAAAGNYSSNNNSSPLYPASYGVPNIISVAATTSSDSLASFSNYGSSSVHIGAPGVWILSTYLSDEYAQMSGTSMASPIVAGVAALMVNEKPTMNGYQVREILLNASDSKASLSGKVQGSRRLNSEQSVIAAKAATVSSYMPSYTIYPDSGDRELAGSIASSGGGGCGMVTKMYSDMSSRKSQRRQNSRGLRIPPGAMFGLMLAIPLLFWMYLKSAALRKSKRKSQRYSLDSDIKVYMDGKEISANLKSISEGGAGISIEHGGFNGGEKLTLRITGGEKEEVIELSGHVVWTSEQDLNIGVQFEEKSGWIIDMLRTWNTALSTQRN